jgi:ABC-2 type transport system permease protein
MLPSRGWLPKLAAFGWKDLQVAASYRTDFLLRIFGIASFTLLFYFVSQSGDTSGIGLLEGEEVGYFPYVTVGLAFFTFLNALVNDFPETIRTAQTFGVLEPMLITSTSIPLILTGTLVYPLLRSSVNMAAYLLVAALLGVDFSRANILSAATVFGATVLAFGGLGAVLGAVVMVVKQNFSRIVLQTLFALFGGVFFPVEALPPKLRWIAAFIPLTPALEGMRAAVLQGATLVQLWQPLLSLLAFAGVFLPLGYISFRISVRVAQKDGTLTYR